jgi:hypothetical protein
MAPTTASPSIRPLALVLVASACVTALAIGCYDRYVRQPATPRLAVVDVARLYAQVERANTQRALEHGTGPDATEFAATARTAAEFGPTLERTLHEVSDECRCAIVAMAAVYGSSSTVPDFTDEVGRRLGAARPRVDGARRNQP